MFNDDDDVIQGLTINAPTPETIIFQGCLKKKSPKGFLKAWQERYVVLTHDGLFYYKASTSKEIRSLAHFQGAIPLRAINLITKNTKKGHRLDIDLDPQYGRVFSFTAKDEKQLADWFLQVTLQRNECLENDRLAGVVYPAATAAPGGAKIFRGLGRVEKKKGAAQSLDYLYRQLYSPEMAYFLQAYKPLYKFYNTQNIKQMSHKDQSQYSLNQVLSTIFTDFKVQRDASSGDNDGLGSVYVLGNAHYNLTYRSYLLHCVKKDSPVSKAVVQCMDTIRALECPLFVTPLHHGECSDSIYTIYHPPVRENYDTLLAWLPKVGHFPSDVLLYILIHIVIILRRLHEAGLLFLRLSPEHTFFDKDGVFRVYDLTMSPDLEVQHNRNPIPEYSPPEVCRAQRLPPEQRPPLDQIYTQAGDFWRVGVFLYELSTGFPPFTANNVAADDYEDVIAQQIINFRPENLHFPPHIQPFLRDLIQRLMNPDPKQRLGVDLNSLLNHPFLKNVPVEWYDITYLLMEAPKPQFITDNIISQLYYDEDTPTNLTLLPDSPTIHRLEAHLLGVRYLKDMEQFCKLQFAVGVEPDHYKTQSILIDPSPLALEQQRADQEKKNLFGASSFVRQQTTSTTTPGSPRAFNDSLSYMTGVSINEEFTFDFLHQQNTSHWPDLTIEIYTQKRDGIKDYLSVTSAEPNKMLLYAIVTIPIAHIRNGRAPISIDDDDLQQNDLNNNDGTMHHIDGWYQMFSVTTNEPCGELHFSLTWDTQPVKLNEGILNNLSSPQKPFVQTFGRQIAPPKKKLYSTIMDPSVTHTYDNTFAQQQQQNVYGNNNNSVGNNNNNNNNNNSLSHANNYSTTQQHYPNSPTHHNNHNMNNNSEFATTTYHTFETPTSAAATTTTNTPATTANTLNSPSGASGMTPSLKLPPQPPPHQSNLLPIPRPPPMPIAPPNGPAVGTYQQPINPEDVAVNWMRHFEEQTGRYYFLNRITQRKTYDTPACISGQHS